jgi:hypothetical protein
MVHEGLSYHQLKLVASMPVQMHSLIVVFLWRSPSAHQETAKLPYAQTLKTPTGNHPVTIFPRLGRSFNPPRR